MSKKIYDYAILGAGLHGMKIAKLLKNKYPSASILLIEKRNKSFYLKENSLYLPTEIALSNISNNSKTETKTNKLKKFCQENDVSFIEKNRLIIAGSKNEKTRMQEITSESEEISTDEALVLEDKITNESKLDASDKYYYKSGGLVDVYKLYKSLFNTVDKIEDVELSFNTEVKDISSDKNEISNYSINTTHSQSNSKKQFHSQNLINCTGVNSLKLSQNLGLMKDHKSSIFLLTHYSRDVPNDYPSNIISTPPLLIYPGLFTYNTGNNLTIGPSIRLSKLNAGFFERLRHKMEWLNIFKIFHSNNKDPNNEMDYNHKINAGKLLKDYFGVGVNYMDKHSHTFEHSVVYNEKENKIEADFIFLKEGKSVHLVNFNLNGGLTSFISKSEEVVSML